MIPWASSVASACGCWTVPNTAPRDSVRAAVRRMKSGGHRHLPIVDDDHRPVGVVSAKRIVRYRVEHDPAAVYCQPPDPTAHPAEAEGA